MSNITIYHNPACGTSRNTLEMIRNSGIEPTVILYLETPPSRDELVKLIADMGISVRTLLRKNVEPYEELGLAEDKFTDDQLIPRRWVLKVKNNGRLGTAVADHLQRITRGAAGWVVITSDVAHIRISLQCDRAT